MVQSHYQIDYLGKFIQIIKYDFFLGKDYDDSILEKLKVLIENYQFILSESKSRIKYVDLRYKDGFAVKKLSEKLYKIKTEKETNL